MDIEIRRSGRKTMAIEVTADARVIVRAPKWVPASEINRFVNEKSEWIRKALIKMQKKQQERSGQGKLTEEDIRELADKARLVIPQRVKYYAEKVGVTYGRITIRNQKSRWGSCSSKGNLNFNCLLMLTPQEVLDYVIVHELCHRREMNHSERFWKEVERVLPDYRGQRKWLRENGGSIIGSMAE